jgi:putative ABC transport system permease protein
VNDHILAIPLTQLVFAFIPALAVVAILWRWSLDHRNAIYALFRMGTQLLLIGYFLVYLFSAESSGPVLAVLVVMVTTASWISLGPVRARRGALFRSALISIALGGGVTLVLVTQVVLQLEPWYEPRYLIPLAGMTFSTAMNRVSLAAERFYAELDNGVDPHQARAIALRTSLIPVLNSLFAVGLVALPGMMTGQILAGVSPLIATRYQIMVMCLLFGASGLAAAGFLALLTRDAPTAPAGARVGAR